MHYEPISILDFAKDQARVLQENKQAREVYSALSYTKKIDCLRFLHDPEFKMSINDAVALPYVP